MRIAAKRCREKKAAQQLTINECMSAQMQNTANIQVLFDKALSLIHTTSPETLPPHALRISTWPKINSQFFAKLNYDNQATISVLKG